MKLTLSKAVASALGVFLIGPAAQAQTITPAQWLAAQPKPAFKAGHTLPRLTRYGWECLPLVTGIPLAEDWGYALEFTRYNTSMDIVAQIDVPGSRESQTVALALANPQVYKLSVCTPQAIPFENAPYGAFTRDAAGNILNGQGVSADGTTWGGVGPLISLEAPDSFWETAGEMRAAPLRAMIARGIPIDNVMNGGESGLGIPGFAQDAWNMDPVIGAAIGASPYGSGSMYNHASYKKGNSELIIAKITKAAVPGRNFFNYYTAGGGTHRNKNWAVDAWGPRWQHTRGTNDIPSNEAYFPGLGFTGGHDILTLALNSTSLEIATGDTLSYNWISGGWDGNVADHARWIGFLKCYYTAGMIGANSGLYGNFVQGQYEAPFDQSAPPYWITQLIATSHVHALFSQLEDLVRNGDLLPGPARHGMSPDEPAYEFPTGDDTARVLVRKRRDQATWLITAWAADGADRTVPINVPELGQFNVEARVAGSVYTATLNNGNVTLIRHDNEGATYTAVAPGTPVVFPVNLTVPLPTTDRLLWLVADSGVTADAAGKVSSWTNQGSVPLTVGQSNAARQPTLVANAVSGKPAIRFANGQTWLENMALGASGDPFIGSITVYAVFSGANNSANGGGNTVVMGVVPNGNPFSDGQGFVIATGGIQQVSPDMRISNGVAMKTSPYRSVASRLQSLTIGETNTPGQSFGFTGDVAEVLVYKGQSPLSQERVRQYLEQKYNISRNSTLVNSGFESPAVSGYLYTPGPVATESRGARGWFFASNSAIQANGSALGAATAPSGIQTAVLQGADGRLGSMSQMVHLSAGSYTLSFKAARRNGQIQPVKVSVNQSQVGSLITPASNSFADYTTASFTVKDGLHLIRMEATDGAGDKMAFIDQVALKIITQVGDGSFESPVVTGLQYGPSDNAWTFENHSGIVANGGILGATFAPNGVQAGVLQGSGAGLGGISQTINFGAGGTYRLSFKAARSNGQIQPVKFSVDGAQVGSLITPTSGFANYVSDSFTVTSGSHVLRLAASDGTGDNSTLIDQVILSERIYTTSLQGGGFEIPAVSGIQNKYLQNPTGSGWDFTSKSYIQANGSTRNAAIAPEGIQTAQLKGSPGYLGAISQTVGFAAGTYMIRFKAARRLSQIQPVRVSVGGTQIGNLITPTSASFGSYSTSSPFTVAAGSHVVRLEATDDSGDTEGNSTFIDEVVIDLIGLTNPTNGGPEPLEVQTLKVVMGSGAANFVEYQQLLFESSSSLLQTSDNLVDWKLISEEPTLRFSTQPIGPSIEKVTITPPSADPRRFFRFRYQK